MVENYHIALIYGKWKYDTDFLVEECKSYFSCLGLFIGIRSTFYCENCVLVILEVLKNTVSVRQRSEYDVTKQVY